EAACWVMPTSDMKYNFPELSPQIKVKRKKIQKLTGVYNRRLAKARLIVEHIFSRMKRMMGT
ncbi:MAG: hypothetical protein QXI38_04895, partial [Conexivisphaerales archaeon]